MPAAFNEVTVIKGAVRRAFARAPVKKEVLMEGRREVPKYNKDGSLSKKPSVQYNCQVCNSWVPSTCIDVDHIKPVLDPDVGFIDWNTFVKAVFCGKENLQRICEECHTKKSNAETHQRWARIYSADLDKIEQDLPTYVTEDAKKALKTCKRIMTKTDNTALTDQISRATTLAATLLPKTKKAKK